MTGTRALKALCGARPVHATARPNRRATEVHSAIPVLEDRAATITTASPDAPSLPTVTCSVTVRLRLNRLPA